MCIFALADGLVFSSNCESKLFVFALGEFMGNTETVLELLASGRFEQHLHNPFGSDVVTVALKPLSPTDGEAYVRANSAPVSAFPKMPWRPLWARWPLFWFP